LLLEKKKTAFVKNRRIYTLNPEGMACEYKKEKKRVEEEEEEEVSI